MSFILINMDTDTHAHHWIYMDTLKILVIRLSVFHHCILFLQSCCHHGRIDRYFLNATFE